MEKEKKEIGIEKLIELFKEYVDKYSNDAKALDEGEYAVIDDGQSFLYGTRGYSYLTLISKKFGMVKWLVENDKININEEWNDYEKTNLYCNSDFFQLQKHYSYYESLLMLLAIQDEPIRFLCEILK